MHHVSHPIDVSRCRLRAVVAILAAAGTMTACSGGAARDPPPAGAAPGGRAGGAPIIITTAAVVEKPMAVQVRAVGNVEASSSVSIRSQVSGELLSVGFEEGGEVTAGQVLFMIEPRPFEVAVRQAEAALARTTAQARGTKAQFDRSEELFKQGLVPRSEREAITTPSRWT